MIVPTLYGLRGVAPPTIPEEVAQPLWELALIWLGGLTTVCAAFVIMWKIAKPHVKGYIESVVKPLQDTANLTHRQLTVNGGKSITPTVLDRIHRMEDKINNVERLSHRNARKIDGVKASLEAHESEGRVLMADAVKQFAEQGITLRIDNEESP